MDRMIGSENVFADLGFEPMEAANLKLRAELMIKAQKACADEHLTQAVLAKRLELTQPRLSNLLQGKIEKFTLDALVNVLDKLGHQVKMHIA